MKRRTALCVEKRKATGSWVAGQFEVFGFAGSLMTIGMMVTAKMAQRSNENLQVSESRISDADISVEMTMFVKNQILTQAAVAMLSQANSLPRVALQLLQG